jgi:hypothetical protein
MYCCRRALQTFGSVDPTHQGQLRAYATGIAIYRFLTGYEPGGSHAWDFEVQGDLTDCRHDVQRQHVLSIDGNYELFKIEWKCSFFGLRVKIPWG